MSEEIRGALWNAVRFGILSLREYLIIGEEYKENLLDHLEEKDDDNLFEGDALKDKIFRHIRWKN